MCIGDKSDATYFSMGWKERSQYIIEQASPWYNVVTILMNIWIWSEFVVMLTNKRRRALHDFIAGTVVIRKEAPNKALKSDA